MKTVRFIHSVVGIGAGVAVLSASSSEVLAAVVAQYNFGQLGPHVTDPNLTASNVTRSSNSLFNAFNHNTTSSSYTGGSSNPFLSVSPSSNDVNDQSEAVSNGVYWYVTLTPSSGYTIDLDTIKFTSFRGGTSQPRGFAVYSSVDSFSSPLLVQPDEPLVRSTSTFHNNTITLGSGYDNLAAPVTFRFYIWTPTNTNTIDFDDLTFEGNVIPEPSGLLMLGSIAGMLVRRRRV
ncbi:MAG: hypothetical protein KatS3mg104_2453 [Phycisphaerae bacterium]|jgi:hypothetical protein|nr:MAG: hypothetical protein KatS3mg104_2453 [Phycisphaerae bacterium]